MAVAQAIHKTGSLTTGIGIQMTQKSRVRSEAAAVRRNGYLVLQYFFRAALPFQSAERRDLHCSAARIMNMTIQRNTTTMLV